MTVKTGRPLRPSSFRRELPDAPPPRQKDRVEREDAFFIVRSPPQAGLTTYNEANISSKKGERRKKSYGICIANGRS